MLTDAQVYCMTSMIYLFRPPLTAKAISIGKRRKQSCTPNRNEPIFNDRIVKFHSYNPYINTTFGHSDEIRIQAGFIPCENILYVEGR